MSIESSLITAELVPCFSETINLTGYAIYLDTFVGPRSSKGALHKAMWLPC